MEKYQIYKDIQSRTNGDIYVGVVGPVRVGKSTFITEFMKKLVLPNIEDENAKTRTIDELPQSADGKTVMTTQPRFVPNDAVKITVANKVNMKVRMIDCVGYLVSEAMGAEEDGSPRLVKTPWAEEEMTFEKSAELGTQKVMSEHSTIGVVVTTDGSVTDISRANYITAEEKIVADMKATGKPFVIILNCKNPQSADTKKLAQGLTEKYGQKVLSMNVKDLKDSDVEKIFEHILLEFPLTSVKVDMPKWISALPFENEIVSEVIGEVKKFGQNAKKIGDIKSDAVIFLDSENFDPISYSNVEMGQGVVRFSVVPKENLFYRVLSSECGFEIKDDFALVSYIKDLANAKVQFDKLKSALDEVNETGYGIVTPNQADFTLEAPEVVKQGSRYGVKIKASAPSLHIIKVDVEAEVTPLVGTEAQSRDLVDFLNSQLEISPQKMWETNLLGKSLSSMISDNISSKIVMMPIDAQRKMRKTLGRIINEGKGGVLCILL